MSNVTYTRSAATLKQVRFPSRSRAVRALATKPLVGKTRQSTLTQMDYMTGSMRRRNQIPPSDDESGDDDGFNEPQPSKRRRLNPTPTGTAQTDQSTLTQCVKRFQEDLEAREIADSDEEDSVKAEQDDEPLSKAKLSITKHRRNVQESPAMNHLSDSVNILPPSQEKSLQPLTQSTGKENAIPSSMMIKSASQPVTPQKDQIREIPSSETPLSIKVTPSKLMKQSIYNSSPLKERSVNLSIVKAARRIARRPSLSMTKSSRALLVKSSVTHEHIGTKSPRNHSQSTHKRPHQTKVNNSRPELRRAISIADSEADPEDVQYPEQCTQSASNRDNEESQSPSMESHWQHTFDPVGAALDLDATRFGRTQTQARNGKGSNLSLVEGTDESEDEYEGGEPSTHMSSHVKPNHENHNPSPSMRHRNRNIAADGENYTGNCSATGPLRSIQDSHVQVPSSPSARLSSPLLRPSQTSTVVSTQDSVADFDATRVVIPCSPQKSARSVADLCPSSPMGLPPWSIPQHSVFHGREKEEFHDRPAREQEVDSLMDFSLPPLPPLSLGRA